MGFDSFNIIAYIDVLSIIHADKTPMDTVHILHFDCQSKLEFPSLKRKDDTMPITHSLIVKIVLVRPLRPFMASLLPIPMIIAFRLVIPLMV